AKVPSAPRLIQHRDAMASPAPRLRPSQNSVSRFVHEVDQAINPGRSLRPARKRGREKAPRGVLVKRSFGPTFRSALRCRIAPFRLLHSARGTELRHVVADATNFGAEPQGCFRTGDYWLIPAWLWWKATASTRSRKASRWNALVGVSAATAPRSRAA